MYATRITNIEMLIFRKNALSHDLPSLIDKRETPLVLGCSTSEP